MRPRNSPNRSFCSSIALCESSYPAAAIDDGMLLNVPALAAVGAVLRCLSTRRYARWLSARAIRARVAGESLVLRLLMNANASYSGGSSGTLASRSR